MRWKQRFGIIIFLILFPFPTTGAAENPQEPQKPPTEEIRLQEIVVTPDPDGGIDILPDRSVVYLSDEQTPQTMQTVYDVLEGIAGIDIQRGDFALSDDRDVIRIRGLGGRRMMVRMDGRPIRNAGGFGDTLVDWTSLSLEGIERIEVIRGAHSAVFGETLGGTINIITKKRKFRKTSGPELTVRGSYAADNTRLFTLRVADHVKDTDYVLAGGYRASDGYLRHSDYDIRDFTGRVSHTFPFGGRLSLAYKISDQRKSPFVVNDPALPNYDAAYPRLPLEAFDSPYAANYPGGGDDYTKKTQYADLIFEQASRFGNWKFHLFHSSEKRDAVLYQSAGEVFYDNAWHLAYEDYGWIIQNNVFLNASHQFVAGFEGRTVYGEYHTESPFRSEGYDRDRWMTHLAGYVEHTWKMNESLELVLGLRYDRADICLEMSDFEDARGEWSPKSGLVWKMRPDVTGFAYVSKAFRVPTAMEYGWIGYPTGEHLKNETAIEYEVGILKAFGERASLRCTAYHYDVDNYILFNEALNPRVAELSGRPVSDSVFNVDHVKLRGAEAELSFRPSPAFSGYLTYTYHDADMSPVSVPEGEPGPDIAQIPRHRISTGIRWSPLQNTKLVLTCIHSDARKTSRGETVGSFWLANTGIEQYFWNKTLSISGYVTNLFDRKYEEKYCVPSPDRRFGVRLNYRY